MSTGLAASTVTPGITAPLVSRTSPLMALWADAPAGARSQRKSANPHPRRDTRPIIALLNL